MEVVIDGEESEEATVDSGVSQGTVLGSLLFLCHINEIPDAVKSNFSLTTASFTETSKLNGTTQSCNKI